MKCLFFIPLYNWRAVSTARFLDGATRADALILDLEDSLEKEKKPEGRKLLPRAIEYFSKFKKPLFVRVNSEDSELRKDLEILKQTQILKIIPTKVNTRLDLEKIQHVDQFELYPFIETPEGVVNSESILGHPKVKGCFFGPEDLAVYLQQAPSMENMQYSAAKTILAAALYGIPVYGYAGPIGLFGPDNLEQLKKVLQFSKNLGFHGSYATHFSQILPILETFSLTTEELNLYDRLLKYKKGRAVFAHKGVLYGPPMIKRIKKILGIPFE